MSPSACPACGCGMQAPAHAIVEALRGDDLDRALELGLLDAAPCASCSPACAASLQAVRDEREAALAARERYRARQARLARLAAEKAAARSAGPGPIATADRPALPRAAADALARAMARAKGRTS